MPSRKGKRQTKKDKLGKTESERPEFEALPGGCHAVFLSVKSMERYELKTGPLIKDTVDFKRFSTKDIIGKDTQFNLIVTCM